MREPADMSPAVADRARSLADEYSTLAGLLNKASNREMADEEKIAVVRSAGKIDAACAGRIGGLGNDL